MQAKTEFLLKFKLVVPSIRKGAAGEQIAYIKFPVHMRVRIVAVDQKAAMKTSVEHCSRHAGSLLYDLKLLRIKLDLFHPVGSICVHPGSQLC